ncbi:hypothetical protein K2X89_05960 [Myxococcota bacterium]|nr:hypothetical protein [Myxococcota bacterium]
MLKWIIGLLITSPLWFGGALYWASEYGGEKVVLETFDKRGDSFFTTLWVVDLHRQPWLRSGRPDSTWIKRLEVRPDVVLERNGERKRYRATIEADEAPRINYAMREKYGYADRLIQLIHDPEQVVAIRLIETDSL